MQINPEKFGKVGVFMGGISAEREVSLMSGKAVLAALLAKGVNAHAVDVDQDIWSKLQKETYDRIFIALHGPGDEDGAIQGMLEILKIPYTGSEVTASALAMDKQRSKWLWQGLGIATLPFMLVNKKTSIKEVLNKIDLPLAVKPVGLGSTLGVTKVSTPEQFSQAVEMAFTYDDRVMVEHWIEGKEFTVGILADQALPVIWIEAPQGFYDYEAKYFSDATQYHCPSGLTPAEEAKVQSLALSAYQALGCRHWGRVDLMQDQKGKYWILEVNTIPGLTSHSLVPKAAKVRGIDFPELTLRILAQTL